ncbi:MAG: x-prolyl-dipeptidyl aminopeptidase [Actinomycetia bacterium]|nr:x-prolyl-dipeptidyl aminopeptidase [Actinomycetes bacterium]
MSLRTWAAAAVTVLAGISSLAAGAPVAAAPAPAPAESAPVYSYANAIRESVWVRTTLDGDGDGVPDTVAVDLIRPRTPQGVKVPVIMDASPYYQCCGRGNESETKKYAADGTVTKFPLFYDNYFVPRGYAYAAVDMAGTSRSTGCGDEGGKSDVLGVKAVVDWLGGRATATHQDGSAATAASWASGKTGMIGKSWDATLANGVASTGVSGLTTIVPISGISSWYDYQRSNGVVYYPGWTSGLAAEVSGRPAGVCDAAEAALDAGADDAGGSYNAFWAERDYLRGAANVKASVLLYHGINDTNVETKHFAAWWSALAAHNVPRKIWLSQGGHVDPFDLRRSEWVSTLHHWFDYWLLGIQNGIMAEPMASIERAPGQWVNESTWPAAAAAPLALPLGRGDGQTGTIGSPVAAGSAIRTLTDSPDPAREESATVAAPNTAQPWRQVFLGPRLTKPVRVSGTPTVTLRFQSDHPSTELSARLVDYGPATRLDYLHGEGIKTGTSETCWGSSTPADDACYKVTTEALVTSDLGVLTRGWMDAAHRNSDAATDPLQPGQWYTATVPLRANESVIPAGHVLGLVVTLSDLTYNTPSTTGATVTVDLAQSHLTLPTTAAAGAFTGTGLPPHLPVTPPAPHQKTTGPQQRFTHFR